MSHESHPHQSHPKIVRRLKRAEGHLRTIITMIEEGSPCIDLAQQLQAVENAIDNAKKALIHDHIDHCLDRSMKGAGPGRKVLKEFRAITKYL
jgi:DNA-binding FrmR family transcriptional regulator